MAQADRGAQKMTAASIPFFSSNDLDPVSEMARAGACTIPCIDTLHVHYVSLGHMSCESARSSDLTAPGLWRKDSLVTPLSYWGLNTLEARV